MGDYMDNNEVVDEFGNELGGDEERYYELGDQDTPSLMTGKKILSRCGLYLSLMTFAIFAVQILITIIVAIISDDAAGENWFNILITAVGVGGVGLPVFYKLMKRIPDSEKREQKKLSIGKFLGFFLVCSAGQYISNMVGLLISGMIELIKGIEVVNPVEILLDGNMVLTMIYVVICGPILEELIFRKILLDKLRRFGDLPAMLISGFAFGLFHFNLSQFFYATVLGILFAYITLHTNRIRYSILLHILINLMGGGITPLIAASESFTAMSLIAIWLLVAVTVGSVLFIVNIKKVKLYKPNVPLVRKSNYIFNPGGILFLTISLVMIILSLVGN